MYLVWQIIRIFAFSLPTYNELTNEIISHLNTFAYFN